MATAFPANRFTMPLVSWAKITGAPAEGWKLYFYLGSTTDGGTSSLLDTYSDAALSKPNDNPVIALADGVWPPIFLGNGEVYRVVLTDDSDVDQWAENPVSAPSFEQSTQSNTVVIECVKDGNGGVPLVGLAGDVIVPFDCTITAVYMMADQPGDIVVDVWVAPFETNNPPTSSNSIVASDPPELSSSVSSVDTTLTGWSTVIAAGSQIRFNIDSIDTLTRITIALVATAAAVTP